MGEVVRWGIIGCGKVCEKKSGPPLAGVEGSRLVAVMRRTRELAEDFARRHGVPRFHDTWEGLLGDTEVDAVYVATPNNTHLEPVLAAARAGKHVLCEKPMARNAAACQEMIDVCREEGVVLAVAYYRRGYPSVLRAKELMDSGAIGRPERMHVNDEFPLSHRLDLVHFFFGDVSSVWSRTEKLPAGSHAEEGAVLHCRTRSGVEAAMNIGWDEKLAPETLEFRGSDGELLIRDLKQGKLAIVEYDGKCDGRDGKETPESLPPLPATHWGLVENFVKHVNGGAPLACDGVEGRKSTVILDIVEKLEPDGSEVAVDYS